MNPVFSVIIPAHNEEKYIKRCIRSVKRAAEYAGEEAEIIVVCNRCTDRTEELASEAGARTVSNEVRSIAKVRNEGILAATGRIIVTIDADNRMTKGTLAEIRDLLSTGKYIGGGAPMRFERYSFLLWLNDLMCRVAFAATGLYCGIFWAERETFLAVGGFTDIKAMEDVATAKALRNYGRTVGKTYTVLKKNYLLNSTRKQDELGDGLYFRLMAKNTGALIKASLGDPSELDGLLDKLFYDYNG